MAPDMMRRKLLLSPHDAALVKRDAAIPGLATLLDPEAFAAALRPSLPGVSLRVPPSIYVRYKPRMNCLVAYQLEVDGVTLDAYAKGYQADASDQLRNAIEKPSVAGSPPL